MRIGKYDKDMKWALFVVKIYEYICSTQGYNYLQFQHTIAEKHKCSKMRCQCTYKPQNKSIVGKWVLKSKTNMFICAFKMKVHNCVPQFFLMEILNKIYI